MCYSTEAFVYSSWRSIAFIATEHLCCVAIFKLFLESYLLRGASYLFPVVRAKIPFGEQTISFIERFWYYSFSHSNVNGMSLKEFYAKELWTLCKVITDNFMQVSSLRFVFTKKHSLCHNNFKHFVAVR